MMIKVMASVAKEMLTPLVKRSGTMLAAYLAASGVPAETGMQLLTALGIAGGLVFDVSLILLARKSRDA